MWREYPPPGLSGIGARKEAAPVACQFCDDDELFFCGAGRMCGAHVQLDVIRRAAMRRSDADDDHFLDPSIEMAVAQIHELHPFFELLDEIPIRFGQNAV